MHILVFLDSWVRSRINTQFRNLQVLTLSQLGHILRQVGQVLQAQMEMKEGLQSHK
jgi:hypothetical protein